ncbi:MAG: hypothetical protein V7K98_25470 [Nostoc sp.]|uniref:hypothetical protein n=1 Tax=Nostoc sp. TaxID=1180 RepID=UPI002FFA4C82
MRNETQHFSGFVGFRIASTQPTNILNRAVLGVIRILSPMPNAQCPIPNPQ